MAQTFGEWLTAAMNERRWTPAQLARRSRLSSVATVLRDQCLPSYVARVRLAQGLNLPLADVERQYQQSLELMRAGRIAHIPPPVLPPAEIAPHKDRDEW